MEKQHSRSASPLQSWETNTKRTPVQHRRTTRVDQASVVTSSLGGKLVPLKMIPLLREDGIRNSRFTLNLQMAETAAMLLNPVRISAAAYLVPKMAMPRFKDMGSIHRSYNGQPEIDDSVIPWFNQVTHDAANPTEIMKTLGIHLAAGETYNTDYVEAYNILWNHIAANRSPALTARDVLDQTLAPAFWTNTQMQYVKPTFDDAMLAGEVNLTILSQSLPVKGINRDGTSVATDAGLVQPTADTYAVQRSGGNGQLKFDINSENVSSIYAELQEDGVVVSLANIDLARETAAWARMRTQYQGLSEEWMMDQLLAGVRLRDETLNAPILLDARETLVGMSQRYATDSGNLDKSATDGRTSLQLNVRAPAVECGGTVVIVAQALPEMLYERQRDYYMAAMDVKELPNRTNDELDVQPVSLVKNGAVDESHSLPNDLFGYAPLNHQWQRIAPNVGGRYYRSDPAAAWDEDRNRLWTSEVTDPALGPDFYMSTTLSHQVFASQNEDPFEWWLSGSAIIEGLTFFGPQIREAQGDYDHIKQQVYKERVKGDGTDTPVTE